MSTFHVLYLKGGIKEGLEHSAQVCEDLKITPWSLRGNPMRLQVPPNKRAQRFSLLSHGPSQVARPSRLSTIGSISLVRISEDHTRVAILDEDLAGQELSDINRDYLIEFCLHFTHLAEATGLRAPTPDQRTAPFASEHGALPTIGTDSLGL